MAGTTRSEEKAEKLASAGFEPHLFDRDRPLADAALAGATHILLSVAPDTAGDPVLTAAGEAVVRCQSLAWLGYLSTTGVYGDTGGAWVDEDAALNPTAERSRRRVAAEQAWRDLAARHDLPLQIFRLAGIYGPGRSTLDSLRQGSAKRIDKPGQVFSRIHVEDIAGILEASVARPAPGGIYNVCDDLPAAPAEVVAFAAGLLGMDPPPLVPFAEADLSPMARSFYADNRRVRNGRIKRDLGAQLRYPDYKAGLTALFDAGY